MNRLLRKLRMRSSTILSQIQTRSIIDRAEHKSQVRMSIRITIFRIKNTKNKMCYSQNFIYENFSLFMLLTSPNRKQKNGL